MTNREVIVVPKFAARWHCWCKSDDGLCVWNLRSKKLRLRDGWTAVSFRFTGCGDLTPISPHEQVTRRSAVVWRIASRPVPDCPSRETTFGVSRTKHVTQYSTQPD